MITGGPEASATASELDHSKPTPAVRSAAPAIDPAFAAATRGLRASQA
jgi:hypothetical protein